jgi:hypothetical protein
MSVAFVVGATQTELADQFMNEMRPLDFLPYNPRLRD